VRRERLWDGIDLLRAGFCAVETELDEALNPVKTRPPGPASDDPVLVVAGKPGKRQRAAPLAGRRLDRGGSARRPAQ
jgi:hypothetical protein